MIALVGAGMLGLVCGWLFAQRLVEPPGASGVASGAAAVAVAAAAGEAALLAGRGAALALLVAAGAGVLLRTAFSRSAGRRQAAA